MFDFSDPGSAQNRFCGTDLPRIGGIQNKHFYISEGNQLIIWLKTNSDLKVGTGFQLEWRGYDCLTDSPILDQGTCKAKCPTERSFNDQGTCVADCPTGRVINRVAPKTCGTTCPDQGNCDTTCPPADGTDPSSALLDKTTCVEMCPMERPFIDQMKVCMADCPTGRVINAAEKTCGTTCPDQGTCVTNCPPDKEPLNILLDQTTCVPTCPMDRPNNDHDTCVKTCPSAREDTNNDMICGN